MKNYSDKDLSNKRFSLDQFNIFLLIEILLLKVKAFQINPILPGIAYLYPLKTSENLKVF